MVFDLILILKITKSCSERLGSGYSGTARLGGAWPQTQDSPLLQVLHLTPAVHADVERAWPSLDFKQALLH